MKDVFVDGEVVSFVGRRKQCGALTEPTVKAPVSIADISVSDMVLQVPVQSTVQVASTNTPTAYARIGKRMLDCTLVLLSLPITLPIVLLCALALMCEGGAPFYRQPRLGRNGKVFSILKLRTMVRNADTMLAYYLDADPELRAEWDAKQKLKHDPRITRVGKILRVTSMDELPQLWNVLTGKMSLVGPRPMMPDQLDLYGDPKAYFALRPGITGKWQVSARNESSFAARQHMDREYFLGLGLGSDVQILRRTFGVVFRRTGC